ncbi:MAG: BON domain-containing protein [Gammaproteobacteria bacterium]
MKKYLGLLFAFISCVTLLTGCAAALISGGAAGGYTAAQNKDTLSQYSKDSVITSKVKAKFLADVNLKSYNISVATNNGIVTLTGTVPNAQMRKLAITIASHTDGVRAVNVTNLRVTA